MRKPRAHGKVCPWGRVTASLPCSQGPLSITEQEWGLLGTPGGRQITRLLWALPKARNLLQKQFPAPFPNRRSDGVGKTWLSVKGSRSTPGSGLERRRESGFFGWFLWCYSVPEPTTRLVHSMECVVAAVYQGVNI